MIMKEINSNLWPFIEAKKVLKRFQNNDKEYCIFQTGYGPSGLPHIGTFDEWKAEGGLKGDMPFGQLPSIELPGSPGRFIAQSGSCSRAVANICGLCPVDLVEMSYQDSLFEAGQVRSQRVLGIVQ